ncbi:hypothetical protein EYC80_000752 [Monilinia laxa]|uniref:Uncharacterized protein n=1 Tax=Monilinia laxa TaxID=61186 RepID=A0A5N6K774_MONLA|nr:hypothetical protein EYC80_000752 [Monilinia laxa]
MSSHSTPIFRPRQEGNSHPSGVETEADHEEYRSFKYIEHLFHPTRYQYTKHDIQVIQNAEPKNGWRAIQATRLEKIVEEIANLYREKLAENGEHEDQGEIPWGLLGNENYTNSNRISKTSLDLTVEFVNLGFSLYKDIASQGQKEFIEQLNKI